MIYRIVIRLLPWGKFLLCRNGIFILLICFSGHLFKSKDPQVLSLMYWRPRDMRLRTASFFFDIYLCDRFKASFTPVRLRYWGGRSLTTPIEELSKTDQRKAKLFSKVYREAKHKGVPECLHYLPIFIDEVPVGLPKSEVC